MKNFSKFLALVLTIAMIASFGIITASAATFEGDGGYLYIDETDGLVIDFEKGGFSSITGVKVNDNALTLNTDYTIVDNGECFRVKFSKSFMENTYIKDVEKVQVSFDSLEPFGVNIERYWDYIDGYEIIAEDEASGFVDSNLEKMFDFFVEKEWLTSSEANGVTTYSLDGTAVFVVDVNNDRVYPTDVNCFDAYFTKELTYADSFEICKKGLDDDYYGNERIAAFFGTRCIIDLSSFAQGETIVLMDEDSEDELLLELYLLPVLYLEIDGQLTMEEVQDNLVIKDKDGKALITITDTSKTLSIIISEDLTADDNMFTNIELDEDIPNFLVGVVFKKPEIVSGDKSKWKNGDSDLTFKSTANFDEFEKVLVDGEEVDEANYTKAEGSTIVTLKASFLKTLKDGDHTLSIVSYSGTATATFTVGEEKAKEEEKIAPTADNSAIGAFVALSTFAAAGLVTLKKKHD